MFSHKSETLQEVDEEAQPFLSEDVEGAIKLEDRADGQKLSAKFRTTPLPKAQLASLCAVRLVDPIAFTQIFPYVNEMMDHLHVTEDRSKIGFYSGLVESSFAVSQLLSIYHWAKFSDRVGRRPVVLIGILGIATSTLLLGLSRTLAGVLIARCLAGFFSGNIAVIHSVLGEITDSTNQAFAFPIYGLCWPLGSIIGPLFGGSFSKPADKFPQYFSYEIWQTYPYLLPCLMAASVAVVGSFCGYLWLEESLPSKRRSKSSGSSQNFDKTESEKPVKARSIKNLLSIPVVKALCLSGCALSFINTAFDVIFVLFCYTPIESGGLSFSAAEIGYSLATSGAVSGGLQLFFMPFLLRRFDHAKMYNFCMAIWPYCYLILPGINILARMGTIDETTGNLDPFTRFWVWVCIAIALTLARSAGLSFSVSMILVKDSSPDPSSLGATNGLAQFAMCFARAFSPAFASSLFAISTGSSFVLMRYLWVIVMTSISLFGTTFSRKIQEGRDASTRR
ncbi:MFS general substrate transporter [Abortiporus biennis]|nr:MFS general substrate transporter [Abortiporus biennis]